LRKDEVAPYNGYLFTPQKEQEVRTINESYGVLKNLVKEQDAQISLLNERIGVKDEQLDKAIEQVGKSDNILTKIGFFVLGAVLTTGMVYGVKKATN